MDARIGHEDVAALGEALERVGVTLGGEGDASPPSRAVGEYVLGCDLIVGAGAVSRGKVGGRPKRPAVESRRVGKVTARFAQPGLRKSPHKLAVKRAEAAVKRALTAGTQAAQKARSYDPKKHRTVVPMGKVTVKGEECLGADRVLTARQRAAVQRHLTSMSRHQKTVEVAKQRAAAAMATAKRLAGEVKKSAAKVKALWGTPKVRILGDVLDFTDLVGGEVLGEVRRTFDAEALGRRDTTRAPSDEVAGDVVGEFLEEDLEWSEPVDGTGSIFTLETADDTEWVEPVSDGDVLVMGEDGEGYGDGGEEIQMPVRGEVLSRDDAQVVWRKVPEDGVKYLGDRGFSNDSVGSWDAFYGSDKNPNGWGWGFLYGTLGEGTTWLFRAPDAGDARQFHKVPPEYNNWKKIVENSTARGWGPLIGNPAGELKGLQFAVDDDVWFWQSNVAPSWATQEADKALADLLRQAREAEQAAAAAEQARRDQEAAEAQERKDKLAAEVELAQTKSDAEAAVARQKLEVQQEALDQQLAAAQAQLDVKSQQADLSAWQSQQAVDVQAQKQWLDYLKANPQAYASPAGTASEDEGYGGPPYGGGGEGASAPAPDDYSDLRYDPDDPNYADPTGPAPEEGW